MTLVLHNARTSDGRLVDVSIDDGIITAVTEPLQAPPDGAVDLSGFLLLPAPAEPHGHLDKALTADIVKNPAGDLIGAIEAMRAYLPGLPHEDFVDRAYRAALIQLRNGTTAIRTHVDLGLEGGLVSLEALNDVKSRLDGLVDLQISILPWGPLMGGAGANMRALVRDALPLIDVLGGCPFLEDDSFGAQRWLLGIAAEHGLPVDLHSDETLDASTQHLATLAELVMSEPSGQRVTASHCVSLGMQPLTVQQSVAESLAAADVGVVTNPQTNLYLQARGMRTSPPRGLTAVASLLEAGVTVAGGGDNLRDPFNLAGRGDALEIASLLVTAGHLSPATAYELVSAGARRVMGLDAVTVAVGSPAELLAVRAETVNEAVAAGPADRVVVHRGRVVARTTSQSWVAAPALV